MTDFDRKKENFLDAATSVLSQNNKFRAFGNSVSFQLEDMDRRQRVIAEKLISDILFHGKLGNLKDYSAVVLEGKNQQRNNTTYNYQQSSSNFMNRHVQSQPYYPDLFYNRDQFVVDPSYAHTSDNYYPHQNYRGSPLQHPPQEIATVSTLQSSAAVTSAQILVPTSVHTLQSAVATATKSNAFGSKTSSAPGEKNKKDSPRIRLELEQFLQLDHSGNAEQ